MTKKPFFSFVVPTFNRSADLQFAIYCILQQTFTNFEIIVSDNCSTDNTREIVKSFKDKRIRYFKNKENIGFILNAKKGISYARGKYIFLHGDDDFLIYKGSLEEVYKKIKKYNPGYIRLNYICFTQDKKRIFDFRGNKPFTKNEYMRPLEINKNIFSFIVDSDPYFVTGIIFKNNIPKNINILDTEPGGWINILFYAAKNFGAYFVASPHIIASWSQWRMRKSRQHPLFGIRDGKLQSEKYFKIFEENLDRNEYNSFLHNQFMTIYVTMFPVIKLIIGNENTIRLANKVRLLDPVMGRTISYWLYFTIAIIVPGFCLNIIRKMYFYLYVRSSKVENIEDIESRINQLRGEFILGQT